MADQLLSAVFQAHFLILLKEAGLGATVTFQDVVQESFHQRLVGEHLNRSFDWKNSDASQIVEYVNT